MRLQLPADCHCLNFPVRCQPRAARGVLTLFRPQPNTILQQYRRWIQPASSPTLYLLVREKLLNIAYSDINLCSDLFPFHPELPASASWDGTSASSWLPASTQQPNEWDDRSIQSLWDDLVSRWDRWSDIPTAFS
jgi:hypothetical protein